MAIGSKDATPIKQPGEEITINADTTIYAVWENLYFTTQPTDTSGKIGTDVKLPVTINLLQVPDEDTPYIVLEVKNGENWEKVAETKRSEWNSLNGGFTVQQNSTGVKSYQYKIYNGAEWIESDTFTVEFLPIVVTFADSTHSTITEPIEVDTVGGKITKPENPTYLGDTFSAWWANGEWDFENRTVTQDITLYASWAGCGYYGDIPNVYAKPGEKAKIDLSNVNYNNTFTYVYKYDGANWVQGENVTNYSYYNLPASAEEKTETYKIVINASKQIESNEFTVTWTNTLPTYTVIYGIGEGSGNGDFDSDIEHGANYTLDSYENVGIIAPEGKVFDYWSIRVGENAMDATEIAQKQADETITVTSNVYAIAMWKNAPTVTVSYCSIGNIVDSDTVAVGTQHTLMDAQGLDVPSGKKFKAWAIGGLGGEQKQPGEQITITEETSIYAVWEDIPVTNYTINATAGANGTISPSGEVTVAEGEDKTFTITANSGYHIKDVKVNGSSIGAVSTYTFNDVAANATITVEFEVDTVPHVCNPTLVPEDEPDCTTEGKSAYYHCECGKNYEDAQGNTEIANLETWGILNALGHNPSTAWSTDGEYHFKECTRCAGQQLEKAAHTDSNNDGKCDTCEYQMTNGGGNTETPDNPDNPDNTPDDPNEDKDGLGAGAIVGIVIGSVAVAGVGGFALFWFVIKKKTWADFLAVFKKK